MDSNNIEQNKTLTNLDNDNLELNNSPPESLYYPNQNNQISQNQTQNNFDQYFIQPTPTPVYNAPLGVNVEQNISYIPHKSITQPKTNIFLIKIIKSTIFSFIVPFLFAFFFLGIGTFFLFTKQSIGLFCFTLIILILVIILVIYNSLELNNKYEIILGDSHLKVINKAYCCRQRIHIYNKNDLIGFDMRRRIDEYQGKRSRIMKGIVYDFFLLLRNGKSQTIITAEVSLFTKEEINYLLYYVNDYIKN